MYLLEDRLPGSLDPVVLGGTLIAALALVAAVRQRAMLREQPYAGVDYQVLRMDAADALRAWGAAQLMAGLAWLAGLPRLDMPLWSYVALGLGAAGALVGIWRWRTGPLWDRPRDREPAQEDGPGARAESETWEYALIGGAIALSATYVAGLAIPVHQPVHLAVSLLEGVAGYAVGLIVFSPRPKVRKGDRPSGLAPESDAARPRRHGRRT